MPKDEPIVMYDQPDLVQRKTVEGWVDTNGRFWGDDEHMARYCSSTHCKCERCGETRRINSYCRPCHEKKKFEEFQAFEKLPWNGEGMLYSRKYDQWTTDPVEFMNDKNDQLDTPEHGGYLDHDHFQWQLTTPNVAGEFDADDYYSGSLAEDGEVDGELGARIDALNKWIRENPTVLSWSAIDKAWNGITVTVSDPIVREESIPPMLEKIIEDSTGRILHEGHPYELDRLFSKNQWRVFERVSMTVVSCTVEHDVVITRVTVP